MRMVIVMPALAKRDQRYPPIVARVVTSAKAARAPHMCSRVDKPGCVQTENHPEAEAPEHHRYPANGNQRNRDHNIRQPMIGIQPAIETRLRHIWRIVRHQLSLVVVPLADKKPDYVRPPCAIARRMRISVQV